MLTVEPRSHLHEWQTVDEYYDSDKAVLELQLQCPLCGTELQRDIKLPKRGARKS